MMRRLVGTLLLVASVGLGVSGRASADFTYEITGTFVADPDPTTPTGLAGGTFSGFFTLPTALPTTDFDEASSFEVQAKDASGTLLYLLSSDHGGAQAGVTAGATGTGYDFLTVFDSFAVATPPGSPGIGLLTLFFPSPFNGTGTAYPTNLAENSGSSFILTSNAATIASARSFAVPEPSTLALAGVGLLGLARLRRGRLPSV